MPLDEAAFWGKVKKSGGCWEWMASLQSSGYGQFRAEGRIQLAHRIAYQIASGPIPPGKVVRHTCDNKRCVNPRHLLAGTQLDNMRDMISRGRAVHIMPSGQRNHASKLSDESTAEIRSDFTSSLSALARKHGVSPSRISQIQDRKRRLNATGDFIKA